MQLLAITDGSLFSYTLNTDYIASHGTLTTTKQDYIHELTYA